MIIKNKRLIEQFGTDDITFESITPYISQGKSLVLTEADFSRDDGSRQELEELVKIIPNLASFIRIERESESFDVNEALKTFPLNELKELYIHGNLDDMDLHISEDFKQLGRLCFDGDKSLGVRNHLGHVKIDKPYIHTLLDGISGFKKLDMHPFYQYHSSIVCEDRKSAQAFRFRSPQIKYKGKNIHYAVKTKLDFAELTEDIIRPMTPKQYKKFLEILPLITSNAPEMNVDAKSFTYINGLLIQKDAILSTSMEEFDGHEDELFAKKEALSIEFGSIKDLPLERAIELQQMAKEKGKPLFVELENEDYKEQYSIEEYIECRKTLEEMLSKAFEGMPEGAGEMEKFKRIYEIISKSISYDHSATGSRKANSTILKKYSSRNLKCLLTGKGVCAGYADVLKAICDLAGIECEYVSGNFHTKIPFIKVGERIRDALDGVIPFSPDGSILLTGGHAWNRVKIDGKWYNVDATWDHDYFKSGKVPKWFGISDKSMKKSGRTYDNKIEEDATTDLSMEERGRIFSHLKNHHLSDSKKSLYGFNEQLARYSELELEPEDFETPPSANLSMWDSFKGAAKNFFGRIQKTFEKTRTRLFGSKHELIEEPKSEPEEKNEDANSFDQYVVEGIDGRIHQDAAAKRGKGKLINRDKGDISGR